MAPRLSATFTTAPTRKKQHTALTNTNTTTLAALKKRPQSKRQKTVSPNNSDDNNNICDDDGYNYDSEDGDGVQSRAFTAERRAAIARLAIQTGEDEEDEDGEDDDSRPRQRSKWTSGKGKQPIYRLSSEQMKSRRSTQQPSMQGEDDEYSSYPSSVLTPRDLQRRKRSSKKMMKEYLGDWEAFNEEKRAASALRRARRAEIAKWEKAFGEQGGGEKEIRSSLNVSQDPFPEVKPRPTEAQYMKHIVGWKKYCIAHLDGDLTVTAAGVLDYIETEVFTDTVIKYIPQGTSYQGVLGLRQPHYNDPRSNAVRRRDNLDIIMTKSVDPSSELSKMLRWNSMKPPAGSNLDLVTWQISTALVETYPKDQAATSRIGTTKSPDDPEAGPSRTSTRPQQDGARDGFGMEVIVCNGGVSMDDIGDDEDDEGDGSSDDESDIDMGDGGPAAMQRPISKYGQRRTTNGTLIPRVALIGSIIDQDNVLSYLPYWGGLAVQFFENK
ncbi:MAG: hypothetical protein J3R72DRAFT_505448 [Linnemannia gamsii]|nr:MAG: hypothetical protein J3R72DRAFT_505448 [Linnemannia gamsii]